MSRHRIAYFATAVAAIGLLSGQLGARAATIPPPLPVLPGTVVPSDLIAFVGSTTTLTCDNNAGTFLPNTTCNFPAGLTPPPSTSGSGVPWVGGEGRYQFNSFVCALQSLDTDGLPLGETDPACSISSTGSYQNIVCGTGVAQGTVNLYSTLQSYRADHLYAAGNYGIVFVSGLGVVYSYDNSGVEYDNDINTPEAAWLDGAVVLTPTAGIPPLGSCVGGFTVVGAAALIS
ncbi:MAG: hypothetical protein ACYDAC_00035 [Candidatus Dormibacteria bacterium]